MAVTRQMTPMALWKRYQKYLCLCDELGLRLDVSRMDFADGYFEAMAEKIDHAFDAMAALEAGAIANPDEGRRVGHYWLRAPSLAPEPEFTVAIEEALHHVHHFAAAVHGGQVRPETADRFENLLVIGIGGSALGPQLAADALGGPDRDRLVPYFFDNTDPDGMARTLALLGDGLAKTLCLVISKSGGTPETRNGMLVARAAFEARGLAFPRHVVAITGEGSELDRRAQDEGWLERFPMWDWVGGRTSETSAVGLLPAALQGLDVDGLLAGAAACDEVTRRRDVRRNPAALLALMWFHATGGRGEKDLVILPYKDRLVLLSRYLQQLIMESLGKNQDLAGNPVEQGIAVYGNKGSTDQHAYVQQLREGVNNFFATFIEVCADGEPALGSAGPLEVEPGVTSGDYLRGFLLGTRTALHDGGRESMTLTIDRLDAFTLGVLIALFERAVGLYALLVGINAYHQPGVEAGKRAAAAVLQIQRKVFAHLATSEEPATARQIAEAIGEPEWVETIYQLLESAVRGGRGVGRVGDGDPFEAAYALA